MKYMYLGPYLKGDNLAMGTCIVPPCLAHYALLRYAQHWVRVEGGVTQYTAVLRLYRSG